MIEKKLQSGSKLEITIAPFDVGKDLYQSVLSETKELKLEWTANVDINLLKNILAIALSSKKIEACVAECMKRCLYNGSKIDKDTFEPVEARQDYIEVCLEVAKENILPFVKGLSAKYSHILEVLKQNFLA